MDFMRDADDLPGGVARFAESELAPGAGTSRILTALGLMTDWVAGCDSGAYPGAPGPRPGRLGALNPIS